jgi:hypothetical protein
MATLKGGLAIVLPLALALTAGCGNPAQQETWLHGTWELAYNPAHDSDDELSFRPDGTVEISTADARHIKGNYFVKDQTLLMLLEGNSNVIDVQFQISPDHARLTYQTGAYYTRRDAAP